MLERNVLLAYLNKLLMPEAFQDYCPNGLQVEGKSAISKIITGVSASLGFLQKGIQAGADLLLVHHGFFWPNEPQTITGFKYQRIKYLIENQVNLVAFHLPLDAHPKLGNNAQLANRLEITHTQPLYPLQTNPIGHIGTLQKPVSLEAFSEKIAQVLKRDPLVISGGKRAIETVGICTGAAQGDFLQAVNQGVDAYLTGEISENSVHLARETGVHFLSCGHHATERGGVQALGAHLESQFGLVHQFIEDPNPV